MRSSRALLLSLLCALLLACALFAPHVRAQDESSTGDEVVVDDGSTGDDGPSGEETSSTGVDESSTGVDASTGPESGSSTGAAPTPGCLIDANSEARQAAEETFVCGCLTRNLVNVTTFNPDTGLNETTTEDRGDHYAYFDNWPWEDNMQYLPKKNEPSPFSDPWLNTLESGTQSSNLIDYNRNGGSKDFNATGGRPVKTRGYPQCYGYQRSCLQQYDLRNHVRPTGNSGQYFCEGQAGAEVKFIKGDPSPPICLVYGGGNRLHKMRFYPKVDQFALLTIQDSFNSSKGLEQLGHLGMTFQVELQGVQSPYRRRYGLVNGFECRPIQGEDGEPDYSKPCEVDFVSTCTVVPFHTIVIHLKQGVLSHIEFDDDDSLCDNDHSVDGNCGLDISECRGGETYDKTNTATSTDCDFKLYVSWAGTDSDGTYLSSSGRRLSQFRRWSLNAVFNQATSFDIGTLPSLPQEE